ncbi:hypothetical protein H4582DRAFT_2008317 [Lactarius indigo]|nr:hypothetical protein H4582DRAFT_2008317 [Lactarius indigo]
MLCQLHLRHPFLLSLARPSTTLLIQIRENVRWSRLAINGIPTGHVHLILPQNVMLPWPVTTLPTVSFAPRDPSWVRAPGSYAPGSVSSLVLAFEDPDGDTLRILLGQRNLYAFANGGDLRRWK